MVEAEVSGMQKIIKTSNGPRSPQLFPLAPAPVFGGDAEPCDHGRERGPAHRERAPPGHGVGQAEEGEDVAEARAAGRETGPAEEAEQEAQHEQAGEVVDERRRHAQRDEHDESQYVRRVAAYHGDFGDRREEHRPAAVCGRSGTFRNEWNR
jgi:hypothetical protein